MLGMRITVHQALTSPILLAGVPRTFAILNGTACAALTLGLHSWYALPVCIALHLGAALLAKKDPYFFDVIVRHIRQKQHYGV